MPLVLNMPGFRIYLNNSWICLNFSDYVWICLNMPEYTGRCVKMPKSAWMTFVLYFPCGYITLHTRSYVLKEHEVVFLKRQYVIFSMAAGSILFAFCFRPNIFTSKIWICCYLLSGEWGWPWILICPSSVLFFLSQNLQRNHVKFIP